MKINDCLYFYLVECYFGVKMGVNNILICNIYVFVKKVF